MNINFNTQPRFQLVEPGATILVIGSGPIVIGQAAEFDYSGTQAVKVLREKGYRTVLINNNPATIMTDPEIADATYIEPLTVAAVEGIIQQEKPDAVLPTVGGQTGLNLTVALHEAGVLDKYQVKLLGTSISSIRAAEDRLAFRQTMIENDIPVPVGRSITSVEEAQAVADEIGFPLLIRASFSLGGSGSSWVYAREELEAAAAKAISASSIGQAWMEESFLGWKEFELEVMRDKVDNFIVVCSVENLDPMGVHTGDSITVAPAQTLTDREYQVLRNLAKRVMRAVGVETGGANVQFAVNPQTGRTLVIEMNPRVSRSSALVSKATGFPIAKIATLVAIGYTLDQIPNDITQMTQAAFEPSIDYVVVKIPRWAFDKFPGVNRDLGPQMKSVGEVLALARTFPEALHKAVQSLECGVDALDGSGPDHLPVEAGDLQALKNPTEDRIFKIYAALREGASIGEVASLTGIDLWFLSQLQEVIEVEEAMKSLPEDEALQTSLRLAKRMGFSDAQIARLMGSGAKQWSAQDIRALRTELGVLPVFLRVDTCAAEFYASTPYMYSTYELEDEAQVTESEKILILGSGPNRIGQGVEFDYCCCQAAFALRDMGYETIILNCNPETVSTDYDTADRLYFEPLTLEHILNVIDVEKPAGVIVQLGGQTPLNLSDGLVEAGVNILGTSSEKIDLSEDRERFSELLNQLDIPQPKNGIAHNLTEAVKIAEKIGFPVLVRPSFVLGGKAMAIVEELDQLDNFVMEAFKAAPGQPVLIDQFLEDAYEVDIDALGDGEQIVIGAVMQHIEEAGVHSGDSACVLPPYKISSYHLSIMREYTHQLGKALNVVGLMNIQFAIKDDIVYVIEVNPRASRTVPFASKAVGIPLAKIASRIMTGNTLAEENFLSEPTVDGFYVKEAVLPFNKLSGSDPRLGPEMHSTGEVMGMAPHFGHAFAKSQIGADTQLPTSGAVLISVNDFDKGAALKIARDLQRMGFEIYATPGTSEFFRKAGVNNYSILKLFQGAPNTVDLIRSGKISLILNTPLGTHAHADGLEIRSAAVQMKVPLLTTLSAAAAAVVGIKTLRENAFTYQSLQAR